MPAIIVLAFNITVLMLLSGYAPNDFLKFSAWGLAIIFTVSVITWVTGKVFGRK